MANDPFLSDPKSKRKRSRSGKATSLVGKRAKQPQQKRSVPEDDEISGISDSDDEEGNVSYDEDKPGDDEDEQMDSEEEFVQESAADKRRRLAKQYLENLKAESSGAPGEAARDIYDFDAQDLDDDILATRLREDVAETKGKIYRFIADNLLLSDIKPTITRVGAKSLTSLSIKFPFAYTVSKDMQLIKWNIEDFDKKPLRVKHTKGGVRYAEESNEIHKNGHSDEILAVAASPDGKYVVSGGRDKKLIVWSTESLSPVRILNTFDRRGEILGLVFKRNSPNLYVACADLKVRSYNIDQFAELETLYGHQDLVVDIAALGQERCVTVGARDRTAMLWKIADETRLTFRGGELQKKKHKKNNDNEEQPVEQEEERFYSEGSIDCVSMLDDSHFVTGSDNGNISLWSLAKKKPLFTQHQAHGILPTIDGTKASGEADEALRNQQIPVPQPYWITSIYAIPYSNVFISGSWNGSLKVWKLNDNLREFELLGELPNARGVVTKIDVTESGARNKESFRVLATLSKEHKLGRWIDTKLQPGSRNAIYSVVIDQQVLNKQ